eukprot:1616550-Alexandrium_andersonii.AAC.1
MRSGTASMRWKCLPSRHSSVVGTTYAHVRHQPIGLECCKLNVNDPALRTAPRRHHVSQELLPFVLRGALA